MATSIRKHDEMTARKKGWVAALAAGGAVTLGVVASSPILGALALVPAAFLGYDWFMFRAKRGMRF